MTSYDQDLYAWTFENTQLLREGQFAEIDVANIIEELESMANRDKRELFNRMVVLLSHLLKWQFQASKRSRSWEQTIMEQRRQLEYILADSPTLHYKLAEKFFEIYAKAVKQATQETKLPLKTFPATCPYTLAQALDDDFYPESVLN